VDSGAPILEWSCLAGLSAGLPCAAMPCKTGSYGPLSGEAPASSMCSLPVIPDWIAAGYETNTRDGAFTCKDTGLESETGPGAWGVAGAGQVLVLVLVARRLALVSCTPGAASC